MAEAAQDQYYFTMELPSFRGEIMSNDEKPLVRNSSAFLVFAEPKKITDKEIFAQKVGELLNIDEATISARIANEHLVWSKLARKIDTETKNKLQELNIDGLGFETESKRYYPESSMAAHLLGFVGSDENSEDKGYFGIEGYYDRVLKGKKGLLTQEKDAKGMPILVGGVKRLPAEDGATIELFVDRSVQFILEQKLASGIARYGAKSGLVVVMDPKTGAILGSAAFPSYDPASWGEFDPMNFPNPLVAQLYEPGSTFKTVIMAAALNERLIDEKSKYKEEGPVKISGYQIRTWNDEYHGEMTMTEILERSSNPGMVYVGQKLGKEKLLRYIRNFGFGTATGIDLEGEENANLRDDEEWGEIDLATATFGQGIAVTPLQMVRAVGAIANEGKLVEPHVAKRLIDPSGKVTQIKTKTIRDVIRPATARTITNMMISAVDKGDAKWAKPPGYRIAGKTGTAQIPVAGHYDTEKTIASFVGFAPADDPKFVMLVLLREPSTSPWGSETAAPLFFTIAKELFAYYSISPK